MASAKDVPASEAEDKVHWHCYCVRGIRLHPNDPIAIGHWNMEKEFNKLNGLFAWYQRIWFG
jgi:hypothetical protein